MENQRDDLVVILAGYADRMDTFFKANPDFRFRVAHHVDIPDDDDAELGVIGENMLAAQNYRFSQEGHDAFARYVEARRKQPHFADARSIRNALDLARLPRGKPLALEDSRNGVGAAQATGVPVVALRGLYARADDLDATLAIFPRKETATLPALRAIHAAGARPG